MTTRIGVLGAGSVAALFACTGSDRPGSQAWHEPLPSLTVELRPPAEMATVWATVEAVPAPEVQFQALIRPDPNHVSPVASPVSGLIVRMQSATGSGTRGASHASSSGRATRSACWRNLDTGWRWVPSATSSTKPSIQAIRPRCRSPQIAMLPGRERSNGCDHRGPNLPTRRTSRSSSERRKHRGRMSGAPLQ